MNMKKCILEIKNGLFAYEEGKYVLQHINVRINQGEKIAVIGNNGAGKSTFFLLLDGVLRLESGSVFYQGEEVDYSKKAKMELRKNVGVVFQDPEHQIIASTVEAEVSFGLFNMGIAKEEVRREVDKILDKMQLTHCADRPPHFLSGGEKKRVSIADVAVMKPKIILFDEPTAGLDCKNTEIFKNNIKELQEEGTTLLIATHDMDFVWEWADRVLVFSKGEIIADAVPEEIFKQDAVLWEAALKKPTLFALYEELTDVLSEEEFQIPKSIEEMKQLWIRHKEGKREFI